MSILSWWKIHPMKILTKQIYAAHTKLDNISLGLVSMGYAWEKVDIDVDKLVGMRKS